MTTTLRDGIIAYGGTGPMTGIFQFIVLLQQDLMVIYTLTHKRTVEIPSTQIKESKEVKKILSLMERMK